MKVVYTFVYLALRTPASMSLYPLPAQMDHCALCLHELLFHRKSYATFKKYILYIQYRYLHRHMYLYMCIQGCKESVRPDMAPKAM